MRAGSQRTILLFALFLMACAAVLFCVSFENTPLEPYRVTSTGQSEAASSAPAASALSEEKVNINTASKEELIGLNGIGEVLADRIIEYREANGGYKDVRELTNVKGIGEKLLENTLAQRQGRAESSKRPALFLQLGKVCKCKRSKPKVQRSFALEQQKALLISSVKFFLTPDSFLSLFSLPSVGRIYLQRRERH